MPIKPIDMLSMPTRSQEASQVHNAENNKVTHAQEQIAVQYNSSVVHNGQQTVKMNKSENEEFRYKDGKRKGEPNSSSEQKKKKEKEKEQKDIKISNFDILI